MQVKSRPRSNGHRLPPVAGRCSLSAAKACPQARSPSSASFFFRQQPLPHMLTTQYQAHAGALVLSLILCQFSVHCSGLQQANLSNEDYTHRASCQAQPRRPGKDAHGPLMPRPA